MKVKYLFSFIILVILLTQSNDAGTQMKNENQTELYNFISKEQANAWRTVNDVVMGGISSSRLETTENQTAIFSGNVSLENNGGFASVRAYLQDQNLTNHKGLFIRVKGDGNTYSFRIRTDSGFDGVSYSLKFKTEREKWLEIKLPFSDFLPTFRGRILSNVEKISPEEIRQIGFLISDKQAGTFELEIDWIKAY